MQRIKAARNIMNLLKIISNDSPHFLHLDVSFRSVPYLMSEWQQDCLGKKQWVLIFLQNIYKLEITCGYHFFSFFIYQFSKLPLSSLCFSTLDCLPLFIEDLLSAIKI